MRLFLDNCISVHLARGVRELARAQQLTVVHLSDRFPRDVTDVEWIRTLGAEHDWVIVSGDARITRNAAERAAWHESGLTAFFLGDGWSSRRYWVQVAEFVRWIPIVLDTAKGCVPGSGYMLPFQGTKPRLIYTP